MKREYLERYGSLLALAALLVVASAASPHFRQPANLLNVLRQVSYTGIVALGLTFVILAGGIDLSVGSMVAWVGGLTVLALNALAGALPPVAAIAVACVAGVAAGAVCGAANGLLVTAGRVVPFIATLGTLAVFRSLALYVAGAGEFRSQVERFADLGMGHLLGMANPVWAFALLAVIFTVLLERTRFGRYVLAVGSNERVAVYAAVPVARVRFLTYVLSGATAGVSAVLLAARLNSVSSTTAGLNFELDAIAAAIIGGTAMSGGRGTIWGTVVGALILGIVNNMLNMLGVSPYLQGTVKGLVIVGAVLIQRPQR
jgi:ribose transport system permease protein